MQYFIVKLDLIFVLQIMQSCWSLYKDARPSFLDLKQDLFDTFARMAAVGLSADIHLEQQALCVLCLEERAQMAFVPCGHKCLCESHAGFAGTSCPICRNKGQLIKIYDT